MGPVAIGLLLTMGLALACGGGGKAPPADPTQPSAGTDPTPTAQEPAVPADPSEAAYAAWLTSRGKSTDGITRGTPPGAADSGWSFFFVKGAPGQKGSPAAVGPDGQVVAGKDPAHWGELMAATDDVAALHDQIGWLHGAWGSLRLDQPVAGSVFKKYPDADGIAADPIREELPDGVRFVGWYFEAPAMTPFRFTVTSTGGETAFERTKLADAK